MGEQLQINVRRQSDYRRSSPVVVVADTVRTPADIVPSDAAEPTTVENVQEEGNRLARDIRRLVMRALDSAMAIGPAGAFKESQKIGDIRAIRCHARDVIRAWQEVEASCDELLRLADRPLTKDGGRA